MTDPINTDPINTAIKDSNYKWVDDASPDSDEPSY